MEHGYGSADPTHDLSRSYAFKPIVWSVQIREPRSDSWRFAGVQNLNEVAFDLIGHLHRENPGHGFSQTGISSVFNSHLLGAPIAANQGAILVDQIRWGRVTQEEDLGVNLTASGSW